MVSEEASLCSLPDEVAGCARGRKAHRQEALARDNRRFLCFLHVNMTSRSVLLTLMCILGTCRQHAAKAATYTPCGTAGGPWYALHSPRQQTSLLSFDARPG